jgi:hypothetical protein
MQDSIRDSTKWIFGNYSKISRKYDASAMNDGFRNVPPALTALGLWSSSPRLDQAGIVVARAVDSRRHRPGPQSAVGRRPEQFRRIAVVLAQP